VFGHHYKPVYKPWYSIFLSQQISRTNQYKRLYEQPNIAMELFLTNHVLLLEDDDVFILKGTF